MRRRIKINKEVSEVKNAAKETLRKKRKIIMGPTVSTGSTILDLAISGGRKQLGGIPGGIIVEIFGPPGSGKTAILAEICASVQAKNGSVKFQDPEARLDAEYAKIYGLSLKDEKDYEMPDTVREMFATIWKWNPPNKNTINCIGTDSLAALSTEIEMDSVDKMGMKRAKDFSEGLRKTARIINKNNWLVVCTNQIRSGKYGNVTPGGIAIPFYSSLRINVKEVDKIKKTRRIGDIVKEKIIGINAECYIKKSTIDDPYRKAAIHIVFGYGIDDIRGNLQWLKDNTGNTKYNAINKYYQSMELAIAYIEKNNLKQQLKNEVVKLWHEIEDAFVIGRQPKTR